MEPTHNEILRREISSLLAGGRAVSTSELRIHLSAQGGSPVLTDTMVYRQLEVLASRGAIARVGRSGRHSYWSRTDSAPQAKSLLALRDRSAESESSTERRPR